MAVALLLPRVRLSPVIGAVDHLYNNSIGRCTETRSICSVQISPPHTQNPGRLTTHRTICCSLPLRMAHNQRSAEGQRCMPTAAKLPALLAGGFIRVRIMVEGYTLPRPRMSERVMSSTGTGIQAGQVLIGAARGRTTRHTRQPTDDEQYLASFDASAAPRRPGGVSWQSYDSA
jgi:hypothetical protein